MGNEKTLRVIYTGDASGLSKTLSQIDKDHATLGSKLKSLGSSMASAGKSMTLGITLPLVGVGVAAVKSFTEANAVALQTQAVLKSTGGAAGVTANHMGLLADKIGALSAVDNDAVQSMENVLATFTNIKNTDTDKIFDQSAKAVANLSAAMGTDLNSAAVQVGKALNDPIKGISALTRVGVAFTDQQKKQIEAMVKAGDTAGAQKMILAELSKEFGGSAKAAGDAASPMQKLALTFDDIAEKIGAILVPMLTTLGEWVGKLASWFQGLSPEGQKMAVTIGLIAAAIGPLLIVVGKLTSAFGTVLGAAKMLFTFLLTNPFIALAAAIIAIGILVVTHFREIKEFVLKVWNAIKEFTRPVWEAISNIIKTVLGVLKTAITTYIDFYKAAFHVAWEVIKTVAHAAWEVIKDVIVHPLEWVWDKIKNILGFIREKWSTVWHALGDIASGVWDGIVAVAKGALNALIAIMNGLIMGWNAMIRGYNAIPLAPNIPTIPHIPSLARGTPNFPGGLALVGERGPELVGLPRGSSVTPARQTRAAMTGGGMTVNVYVAGSVTADRDLAETIRRQLIQIGRANGGTGNLFGAA